MPMKKKVEALEKMMENHQEAVKVEVEIAQKANKQILI